MSEKSAPYSAQNVGKFLNDNFGLLIVAVALFIGGFVIGSLWTENKVLTKGGGTAVAGTPTAPAGEPAPEGVPLSEDDWAEVQADGVFTIGDENAPVTMVEFTDYQCPFCARHFTDTHPQIMSEYVDTGKVKIVYRDQALSFHPNANSAAQAVRCAAEQDGAEAMHDVLFENQEAWSNLSGEAVVAKYAELATGAGLNGNTLQSCVSSEKYKEAVDADSALANRVGAGGTPTFFIEGKPIVGAYPFDTFKAEIDALL